MARDGGGYINLDVVPDDAPPRRMQRAENEAPLLNLGAKAAISAGLGGYGSATLSDDVRSLWQNTRPSFYEFTREREVPTLYFRFRLAYACYQRSR